MLDLVVIDGRARGIVTRDLVTGKIESHLADAVVLATGGYGNVFYLVDQRQGLQRHRDLARLQAGRRLRQPLLHADPPDLHPGHAASTSRKLTLMSESLRNDGRIWVPKKQGDKRAAGPDPRGRARLLPRAQVPELRQPGAARHRLARRQAGLRRGPRRRARPASASTSTSPTPSARLGEDAIARALRQPLRDVRAHHRRGPVQGADAHLPGRRTTRWAGCGWTTT